MDEALKEKVEKTAIKYADLIEKRICNALDDNVDESKVIPDIENGIKMLGYLISAIDRMGRPYVGNGENGPS
ncbi:hypothetical protein QA584_17455 [Anaerocolumna sp. AGMB13025]|uniref:hypothetical protein n=1 Tax=Anaerocolumna sp. AGMB13025 TaxID=3039116 RepID=UPI00241C7748|nr:hypothetical protein [Anaerocolumna sp. AGMB13025]WFR55388.1 hypothetical protein QA584_17455 [Anaerocolumna sp. AGMB13025]